MGPRCRGEVGIIDGGRKSGFTEPMAKKRTQPGQAHRQLRALERRQYVMWLRRGGYSYNKIATEVIRACMTGDMLEHYDGPVLTDEHLIKNYNGAKAYKDVRDTLKLYADEHLDNVEEIRAEIADQLDELMMHTMKKVREGDLYGVQVGLQQIQTKAKLLGINKPERKAIEGPDGGAIPIEVFRKAQAAADAEDED